MATGKSKILIVALTLSLSVNVGIAGFIGAQWFKRGEFSGPPQIGLTFDRRAAFAVLNDADKNRVHKIWKQNRSEMRANFKEYRQAKRTLSSLLTAKQLDKDAIEVAHTRMMTGRHEIEKILQTTLIETAEILPPENRERFFKNGFQRWKSRHQHYDRHPHRSEEKRPSRYAE